MAMFHNPISASRSPYDSNSAAKSLPRLKAISPNKKRYYIRSFMPPPLQDASKNQEPVNQCFTDRTARQIPSRHHRLRKNRGGQSFTPTKSPADSPVRTQFSIRFISTSKLLEDTRKELFKEEVKSKLQCQRVSQPIQPSSEDTQFINRLYTQNRQKTPIKPTTLVRPFCNMHNQESTGFCGVCSLFYCKDCSQEHSHAYLKIPNPPPRVPSISDIIPKHHLLGVEDSENPLMFGRTGSNKNFNETAKFRIESKRIQELDCCKEESIEEYQESTTNSPQRRKRKDSSSYSTDISDKPLARVW